MCGCADVAPSSNRTVSNDGRTLRISRLNHDIDTAVYQCNASNPLGYVFVNAFVSVLGKKMNITILEPLAQHTRPSLKHRNDNT
jgi:hypothetical protein